MTSILVDKKQFKRTLKRVVLVPSVGFVIVALLSIIHVSYLSRLSNEISQRDELIYKLGMLLGNLSQIRSKLFAQESGTEVRALVEEFDAKLRFNIHALGANQSFHFLEDQNHLTSDTLKRWDFLKNSLFSSQNTLQKVLVNEAQMSNLRTSVVTIIEQIKRKQRQSAHRYQTISSNIFLATIILSFFLGVIFTLFNRRQLKRLSNSFDTAIENERLHYRRMEKSESLYRQMADSMPQILWTSTLNGEIEFVNQRWIDFFEFEAKPPGLKDFENVFFPGDFDRFWNAWMHSLNTGHDLESEVRLRDHTTHEYKWILVRAHLVKEDDHFTRWVGTGTFIDHQKLLQKQLEQRETELIQSLQARDEFISIASHELRTPLTSMLLNSQIFDQLLNLSENQIPKKESLLKVIRASKRQQERMSKLIDEMLEASRAGSKKLDLSFDFGNMSHLIQEVVDQFSGQFEASHCRVQTEIEENIFSLYDENRIQQVAVNLLSNAIKYAKNSLIEISLHTDGDNIKLTVKDHGSGIPQADRTRIFERFERVYSNSKHSGLGLGLYITKSIVELHKGTIVCDPDYDNGARFVVTLPLVRPAEFQTFPDQHIELRL